MAGLREIVGDEASYESDDLGVFTPQVVFRVGLSELNVGNNVFWVRDLAVKSSKGELSA